MLKSFPNRFLEFLSLRRALLSVVILFTPITAQQLPVKQFTVGDGLAGNQVLNIFADSRGFLWLATYDGLSRFDGYNFDSYDKKHGLPDSIITGILEDADGVYWVATWNGLARVNFASPLDRNRKLDLQIIKFGAEKLDNEILWLYRDHSEKRIWICTNTGLFQIVETNGAFQAKRIELEFAGRTKEKFAVKSIIEDADGNFWLGSEFGMLRLSADGTVKQFLFDTEVTPSEQARRAIVDEKGRLWFCSLHGFYVVKPPTGNEELKKIQRRPKEVKLPENAGEYTHFGREDKIASANITDASAARTFYVFQTSDNSIWLAADGGVTVFDGEKFVVYSTDNNLAFKDIQRIGEDRAGNVWLSGGSAGVMRIARNGWTSYGEQDGLPNLRIGTIYEGKDGGIYSDSSNGEFINRFNGQTFDTIRPNFPASVKKFGWGYNQSLLQTRNGEWWSPTAEGVFRFPAVEKVEDLEKTSPLEVFNKSNGLPSDETFRVYEDKNEDVWISMPGPPYWGAARWRRATGELEILDEKDIGIKRMDPPTAYTEDANGDLWIGFYNGAIARLRGEKWQTFENNGVFADVNTNDLFFDRRGTLWITTSEGVFYTKNPSSDAPLFEKFTEDFADGAVRTVTDDADGRLYFGARKGVVQYDPNTKRTATFTTEDGLISTSLVASLRDRNNNLWFAAASGVSKFDPAKVDENFSAPTVLLRSIKAGGEQVPLGELGETDVQNIVLQPNQSSIEIEVVGLTQKSGDNLLYQYKLHKEDDWSEPTTQRIFNFARLDSGEYEFQIRATNSNGLMSENSAKVSFSALAPFYLRWWFIAVFALLIFAALYLIYRYRLQKLIEIERIRLEIATDLHDDIGSSLSQISLISEVLATKQNGFHEDEKRSLETIAETSRTAVGSMSEMVWAINPKRDNLRDLVFKMRRFAGETLNAAKINFTFAAPDLEENAKIETDTRRQIYMIFKEAINNAVKHSGCENVKITFAKNANYFHLEINDDGKGFDFEEINELGNGINNMRRRTANIGGKIEIISDASGTKIILNAPAKSGIFPKIAT